jgi:hypothetical protein
MLDIIKRMYKNETRKTGFFKHYNTLFAIVEGLEARNTFEFGTGVTTEVIIAAQQNLQNSMHTSCDPRNYINTGMSPDAWNTWHGSRWTYIQGNSEDNYDKITGSYDFVLHDGSHIPEIVYMDLIKILPNMKNNSILLLHDTENQEFGITLKTSLNKALTNLNIKNEQITLPYSYGLTIVRILEGKLQETVKPLWVK